MMSIKRDRVAAVALTIWMTSGFLALQSAPAMAASWQIASAPDIPGGELYGVAAASATDVWAAGRTGSSEPLIEHWDGTSWSVSPTPALPSNGWLFGISALSASDVWAVGRQTNPQDGENLNLAEHWNGVKWKVVPTPNLYSGNIQDDNNLDGVQALSATDVWAVGYSESPAFKIYGVVERWNGTAWSLAPAPKGRCEAISLVSDSFGWVAGWFGGSSPPRHIARWNGTSWRPKSTPLDANGWFRGVLTLSKGSAWAVGAQGTDRSYPLIEQYVKGTGWSVISPGTSAAGYLNAISVGPTGDTWAVGGDGDQITASFFLRWDGSQWSQVSGPTVAGSVELESVTAVPGTTEFWAVGISDAGPVIEHYA